MRGGNPQVDRVEEHLELDFQVALDRGVEEVEDDAEREREDGHAVRVGVLQQVLAEVVADHLDDGRDQADNLAARLQRHVDQAQAYLILA